MEKQRKPNEIAPLMTASRPTAVILTLYTLIMTVVFFRGLMWGLATSLMGLISQVSLGLLWASMLFLTILALKRLRTSSPSEEKPTQTLAEWRKEWIAEQHNEMAVWENRFTGQPYIRPEQVVEILTEKMREMMANNDRESSKARQEINMLSARVDAKGEETAKLRAELERTKRDLAIANGKLDSNNQARSPYGVDVQEQMKSYAKHVKDSYDNAMIYAERERQRERERDMAEIPYRQANMGGGTAEHRARATLNSIMWDRHRDLRTGKPMVSYREWRFMTTAQKKAVADAVFRGDIVLEPGMAGSVSPYHNQERTYDAYSRVDW